jgi:hypothetical protein
MTRQITWHDVANALDTFIGRLLQRMYEEPQNGEYWQQELAVAMCKKQEAVMLARREMEQIA